MTISPINMYASLLQSTAPWLLVGQDSEHARTGYGQVIHEEFTLFNAPNYLMNYNCVTISDSEENKSQHLRP